MPAKNGSSSVALKLGLVVAAIVVVAVVAFFRFRDTATFVPVTRGTAYDSVPGSVVVYADGQTRELKTEAGGKVVQCDALDTGRHFKKGDLLLQIDTAELDRRTAQTKETYETALKRSAIVYASYDGWKEANQKLDEAKRASAPADQVARLQHDLDALVRAHNPRVIASEKYLTDIRRRHDRGDVSDVELKAAEDGLKSLNQELDLADFDAATNRRSQERDMEEMQRQIDQRTLHAPSAGTIDSVRVWAGGEVGANATVATFFADARIVVAKIGEEDFSKVKLGQSARVRLLIYGNQELDAKVSRILPNAEPETQRYTVYLDVDLDPLRLLPNSNGQVTINVGEHPNSLLIPRRAVFGLYGQEGQVWVVKDGRTELRNVTLGFISLTTVEVAKGLALDEQVVVENIKDFRTGQFVRAELLK